MKSCKDNVFGLSGHVGNAIRDHFTPDSEEINCNHKVSDMNNMPLKVEICEDLYANLSDSVSSTLDATSTCAFYFFCSLLASLTMYSILQDDLYVTPLIGINACGTSIREVTCVNINGGDTIKENISKEDNVVNMNLLGPAVSSDISLEESVGEDLYSNCNDSIAPTEESNYVNINLSDINTTPQIGINAESTPVKENECLNINLGDQFEKACNIQEENKPHDGNVEKNEPHLEDGVVGDLYYNSGNLGVTGVNEST